jgi:hypothetical protein
MANKHMHKPERVVFMDETMIEQALADMERDCLLRTGPVATKDAENAVRMVSFREKHLSYLKQHPKVNPQHYLANLHTMIKIRP